MWKLYLCIVKPRKLILKLLILQALSYNQQSNKSLCNKNVLWICILFNDKTISLSFQSSKMSNKKSWKIIFFNYKITCDCRGMIEKRSNPMPISKYINPILITYPGSILVRNLIFLLKGWNNLPKILELINFNFQSQKRL